MSGRGISRKALVAAYIRQGADLSRALRRAERLEHDLGCVELALAGREPSDDWPAVAHAVAALRAGKVEASEAREPMGAWAHFECDDFDLYIQTGELVASVVDSGWVASLPGDNGWAARGPETGTAGKLAAEAWLDARGVEYERAKEK